MHFPLAIKWIIIHGIESFINRTIRASFFYHLSVSQYKLGTSIYTADSERLHIYSKKQSEEIYSKAVKLCIFKEMEKLFIIISVLVSLWAMMAIPADLSPFCPDCH